MNDKGANTDSIRSMLIDLLVRFTSNEELRKVTDVTSLDECGLDSLAIFEFVLELEREFNISIDDASFNIENFKSVGSVVTFLAHNPNCLSGG